MDSNKTQAVVVLIIAACAMIAGISLSNLSKEVDVNTNQTVSAECLMLVNDTLEEHKSDYKVSGEPLAIAGGLVAINANNGHSNSMIYCGMTGTTVVFNTNINTLKSALGR